MNAVPNVTAPLLGGAVRVAVGVLWVLEGVEKYRAGFGAADILLVADGTASNPRTWRGRSASVIGRVSSSFKQGIWMISFISAR